MKDSFETLHRLWPDRKPFQGAATAYIRFCESEPPSWKDLEEPTWKLFFKLPDLDLQDMRILDLGSGTGRVIDLAIKSGAKKENILALEPNPIMADYIRQKGYYTIKDSAENLIIPFMQAEQLDMITANMVLNHFPTEDYERFTQIVHGVLKPDGGLIYIVPHPGNKACKHDFDYYDNYRVIEEKAPWGGYTQYHHRSVEYQTDILEQNGYDVVLKEVGYSDFCSKYQLAVLRSQLGKSLEGPKRIMIVGIKHELLEKESTRALF